MPAEPSGLLGEYSIARNRVHHDKGDPRRLDFAYLLSMKLAISKNVMSKEDTCI